MAEIKVKNGRGEGATTLKVNFDFPASVEDAVSKYGADTTLDLINRALTLGAQANVRVKMGKDETFTQEQAQAAIDSWVPGVRGPVTKQTPFERASSALKALQNDPAALAELLAKVKAAQKGAAAHA